MYAESLENISSVELMHYDSSTTSDNVNSNNNPDYINNLDFSIYSQPSTLTTDFLENELYNPLNQIGQQASLVNQLNQQQEQTQLDVTNYSNNIDIPLDNHNNLENFHYTTQNQSDFVETSPHGYSENNISTPLLEPYNGIYSVASTPHNNNQLLFSPVINTSPAALSDLILFDDIGSTPTVSDFGTPYTSAVPLLVPNTPYINTPYVTNNNNSPFSVASSTINTPFAFQNINILDTPIETNADPNLYDESGKSSNWFSLFGSPTTAIPPSDSLKTSNNNNNSFSLYIENNMDSISPIAIDNNIEKKLIPSEMSQNDASPSDKATDSSNPVIVSVTEPIDSKIIDTTGIIKSENINVQNPDSNPTTPDGSKLVPIRPRPQDDDDVDENDSSRRSKRQRNTSVSEENEDDNDDESEKKYLCPECGRGFNRKFNMQTHRQTHDPNRVKPFACEHPNCGSRFTRKHDLKRHINGIHKGEKVHECTVCRKPFSRKDAWKRHIATCGKM